MGEVIGEKIVKARKSHRCYWCGETIEPKTRYWRWLWVASGTIEQVKAHLACTEAWGEEATANGGVFETMPYENERA